MMGRAASRLGQRLVAAALAVGAVVASAFAGVRPRARGPRPRVVRAIRLLLPLAVAGMALLVLTTSAESDVGLPVNIDTFGNSALTAGPFTRTVIPLPLPMTSTTPVGTFSQGGDVGTMEMTGLGNGFSGVTLQYTPTAGGSVDLTSDGSNAQILIDFALIDEVPAVGDDSVPGLDMYINATDANGHTAIAPLDAIGNYFAFNAAFPFSGFEGTIDWTKITKIDVTFQYPTTNTGGGTLGVQVNQIWATPEAGTPPSAPSPTVTASPTAIGPAGTAVDFTVSFTSDEGPAPVTYHPPSDIGVRAQDLTVSGSAFGGATPVVKVSGGPSTYTVAVSGMTVSGGVTVDVPGGIVDDAWGQLNTASSDDPTVAYTFAIPCSAGSWSATGYMPCQLADPGYFVSGTQATSESPCAAGTYSSSSGATACTNTPAGTFIASMGAIAPGGSCSAGTYSAAGASACTNTPAGTFIPGNGATGPGSSCLAGTYSAAGASACTNTPAGTFISGTGASGPGGSCPAGTYSSSAGATACTNTPAGTFIASTGATGPGGSCPAGTYSTAGASACTNTPAGTFIASPGAAGPGGSCPAGTYSAAGASACTNTPARDVHLRDRRVRAGRLVSGGHILRDCGCDGMHEHAGGDIHRRDRRDRAGCFMSGRHVFDRGRVSVHEHAGGDVHRFAGRGRAGQLVSGGHVLLDRGCDVVHEHAGGDVHLRERCDRAGRFMSGRHVFDCGRDGMHEHAGGDIHLRDRRDRAGCFMSGRHVLLDSWCDGVHDHAARDLHRFDRCDRVCQSMPCRHLLAGRRHGVHCLSERVFDSHDRVDLGGRV